MNVKRKAVELRTSKHTTDPEAIQRGVDFLTAFVCGFDVDDAIALLRLDDLYIGTDLGPYFSLGSKAANMFLTETFEVKDVKTLRMILPVPILF